MNKEVMLIATGIGIGAMAFTDQGRKLMTAITSSPLLTGWGNSESQALEEGKPKEQQQEKKKEEEQERRQGESEQTMKSEE